MKSSSWPFELRSSSSSTRASRKSSGPLIRSLLDNQLVDEIALLIYPVIIGQGTRLFPDTDRDRALELLESRASSSGVTIQVYRPTGRPQYAA
jgi:dihydrofolate reductase